jgi:hypothetical protein
MSRNLQCNCLCHGSDGNRTGDRYFACKNCYATSHMGGLPREPHDDAPRAKGEHKRKPAAKKEPRKPGVTEGKLDSAIKTVAANLMDGIASAAEQTTGGNEELTVSQLCGTLVVAKLGSRQ